MAAHNCACGCTALRVRGWRGIDAHPHTHTAASQSVSQSLPPPYTESSVHTRTLHMPQAKDSEGKDIYTRKQNDRRRFSEF